MLTTARRRRTWPITVHIAGTSVGLSYATPLVGQAFTLNAEINPTALAGLPHTGTLTLSDNGSVLTSISLASAHADQFRLLRLERSGGLAGGYQHADRSLQRRCELRRRRRHDYVDGERRRVEPGVQSNVVGRRKLYGQRGDHGLAGWRRARTGTLSLVEGSTTLASVNVATALTNNSGQYALTVPGGSLVLGANSLKVVYSGDSNYTAASASLTVTGVSMLATSIGLSYATSLNLGQSLTVNASVNGTLASGLPRSGTLSLLQGSTTLASINLATTAAGSNGYYALTLPAGLPSGTYNLSVAYSGDANYASSTANLVPITVHAISTSVVLSWSTPLAGEAFTVNALISPRAQVRLPHTGTLTLSDNGAALASVNVSSVTPSTTGFYALSVPAGLPLGSNVLIVSYSGDANYAAATSTTTLTVNNDSFSLGYASSVLAGTNYTVSVAINGVLVNNTPRTGTLSLIEGSTTLASVNVATTTPSSTGYYALTVPGGLPAGTYSNLKVTYSGDGNYSALSATMATLTVSNDVLAFSYASSQTFVGQPFSMNVAVQTNPGIGAVPTGTLTLTEGTTTLTSLNLASATASSSGFYTLSIPGGDLALGANSLKLAYSGDANYAAASSLFSITGVSTLSTSVSLSYATPPAGQAFTLNAAINPTCWPACRTPARLRSATTARLWPASTWPAPRRAVQATMP